jgi:hypothetical protein
MDSSLALIEQAHVLTEKADALCARRQERMDLLRDLIEKNEVLCRVLEKPIYVIDPDKVPSHDALTAFSTSNAKLQQERVSLNFSQKGAFPLRIFFFKLPKLFFHF